MSGPITVTDTLPGGKWRKLRDRDRVWLDLLRCERRGELYQSRKQ